MNVCFILHDVKYVYMAYHSDGCYVRIPVLLLKFPHINIQCGLIQTEGTILNISNTLLLLQASSYTTQHPFNMIDSLKQTFHDKITATKQSFEFDLINTYTSTNNNKISQVHYKINIPLVM